ncbi:hypothetical protein ACIQZN_18485 [Streptomyces sp. NPDC097595]|uniref:hypothetical protein n=1 Tax=Streptomyces sp. NPDC097595 TaxID=3366090 RepID=UPI00380716E4
MPSLVFPVLVSALRSLPLEPVPALWSAAPALSADAVGLTCVLPNALSSPLQAVSAAPMVAVRLREWSFLRM